MRGTLAVILFGALIGMAAPPVAWAGSASPDPGCASGTTRVVSHSWWQEKGQPFPGRHIHLGTCFPLHKTISGSTLPLDIDVSLHSNPGTVSIVRASWESTVVISKTVNRSCSTDCTFSVHLDVPTGGRSGWHEVRLTANIPRNVFGDRQYQSTRYPICLKTCSGGYSAHRTGAAGWYHDNYQNAYIDETSIRKIESGPISTPFTFSPRGDGNRLRVSVDANSHVGDPGIVLTSPYTIPSGLPSGWHRLYVRTERDFSDGMSAGQFEIWFRVP